MLILLLNHSYLKTYFLQPIFEDMTQFTEEEKTIRRVERRFIKRGSAVSTDRRRGQNPYRTVGRGKDSLALVEFARPRARIYKPRFSVITVHVVIEPYSFTKVMLNI